MFLPVNIFYLNHHGVFGFAAIHNSFDEVMLITLINAVE